MEPLGLNYNKNTQQNGPLAYAEAATFGGGTGGEDERTSSPPHVSS